MKTKNKRRLRLYSKRRPKFPNPVNGKKDRKSGFSLRLIEEADSRFSVVKTIKRRLEQLIEDAGCDSIQKEILAGRAVFMAARLESMEVEAIEGTEIDWGSYVQACNCLNGVLTKLGLDKHLGHEVIKLEQYVAGKAETKDGRHAKERKRRF